MMKRARANTAESYREAYKACKDQFESGQSESGQSESGQSDRAADAMTAARVPEDPKH